MIKYENHCCDCAAPGYPCMGSSCPNRRVEVHYCDKCGAETGDDLYERDGEEYCEECFNEFFGEEEE